MCVLLEYDGRSYSNVIKMASDIIIEENEILDSKKKEILSIILKYDKDRDNDELFDQLMSIIHN